MKKDGRKRAREQRADTFGEHLAAAMSHPSPSVENESWLDAVRHVIGRSWPWKRWKVFEEAILGRRWARRRHAKYMKTPVSVEAALAAIERRWPDLVGDGTSEPIFILSAGWRSGSTFLQRWLMKSDNILIWGEPYRHAEPIQLLGRQLCAFASNDWPPSFYFADEYRGDADFTQEFVANFYPSMQEFVRGHVAYFQELFIRPAARFNRTRWGLKGVTLTTEDACYLKWLFPRARFLFLYRSPYHAYRSYRRWRGWYKRWPHEPIFTAASFGRWWKHQTTDFVRNHQKVGGLLLPYETLRTRRTRERLEDYLGITMAEPDSLPRVRDRIERDVQGARDDRWVPSVEWYLLKRVIEPVATELGYRRP